MVVGVCTEKYSFKVHTTYMMTDWELEEKNKVFDSLIALHLQGMFVTPKDIDETIMCLSKLISEVLNLLFVKNNRLV